MRVLKLDNSKTGALCLAINSLSLEHYIESYYLSSRYADAVFDCWTVRISCPMEGALHFQLLEGNEERVLDSFTTDQVKDALPIRRVILAMLGKVMLDAFKNEWDGYTVSEGN